MKRIAFFLLIFLSSSLVYPSTLKERIDWLETKFVETGKMAQEDFELAKTHFILLLDAGIRKEDVFAIFNYLLREDLDIVEQLAVLKELSLTVARHDVGSKALRNLVSGAIKRGRVQGG